MLFFYDNSQRRFKFLMFKLFVLVLLVQGVSCSGGAGAAALKKISLCPQKNLEECPDITQFEGVCCNTDANSNYQYYKNQCIACKSGCQTFKILKVRGQNNCDLFNNNNNNKKN